MIHSKREITRRDMLSHCAGAAAFAATLGNFKPLFAGRKSRWFKIGACEFCLCKPKAASFEIAKEIGLDGLQVDMGRPNPDEHLGNHAVQKAYLEAAKKTGLEIASLSIGVMNSIPLKSDPRAAKWLADSIGVCKALGITVSMPAMFGRGDLDMSNTREIDHLVKILKDVAPRAEKEGIVIGLENYLSAKDNMKIIDRVGSPAVKVYYDVGNSTDKGYDILKEIRELGRRGLICEFHAKDGRFMLGQGRIDFKEVRKAIDDIQYNGWFQIEAAHPNGIVPDYRAHYRYLRGIFPERG